MKRVISAAFCLLVIFSATALVFAKGTTTKIAITGAGLQGPVEISDPGFSRTSTCGQGPGPSQTASREPKASSWIGPPVR